MNQVAMPPFPIETARLWLRPFQDEDLSDLYAFHSCPEVARYLYWHPRSLAETKEVLARKQTQVSWTQEGSTLALAVVLPERNRVIGEVSLVWTSQEHQQGEIGFVFHPDYQGQGYASEAARALLTLGFEHLELHRIYGRCDARNVASYRLMERLGLRREAHFVHNEIFKGEWGDELVYAILQEEWRSQRPAAWVERIAQPVADKIDAEHGQHN
jgi:RimJ/RimL family protein N-acetyltransferase